MHLMKNAREIKGIKKIFIRSGVRYDLAIENKKYIEEISKHHISGSLKIAPEHNNPKVLELMNKNFCSKLKEFVDYYTQINKDKKQGLAYYYMIGHPGETIETVNKLKIEMNILKVEGFQLFTPTPMSNSTAMYYTGFDMDYKPIKVIYDYKTKKQIKRIILNDENIDEKGEGRLL